MARGQRKIDSVKWLLAIAPTQVYNEKEQIFKKKETQQVQFGEERNAGDLHIATQICAEIHKDIRALIALESREGYLQGAPPASR